MMNSQDVQSQFKKKRRIEELGPLLPTQRLNPCL